jgi:hypothetical protein
MTVLASRVLEFLAVSLLIPWPPLNAQCLCGSRAKILFPVKVADIFAVNSLLSA